MWTYSESYIGKIRAEHDLISRKLSRFINGVKTLKSRKLEAGEPVNQGASERVDAGV